ncbi:arabinose operon regulatory protein, partial [Vibrio parahaemolyticus AQ3810]
LPVRLTLRASISR